MPVSGAKPKPAGQAVHRVKPVFEWREVENTPYNGPAPRLWTKRTVSLPFGGTVDHAPHAMTRRWWKTITHMPHCILWTDSDWEFALATSLIADKFYYGENGIGTATELGRREKILGTTYDSRRDLRIRYVEPKAETDLPAEVTSMDDYRST